MMSKADEQSKLMSEINAGRTAHVIWGHVKPILDMRKETTIAQLKAKFRAGAAAFKHEDALTAVAQLVVLDDLASEIEKTIHKGEYAARKLDPTND